MMHHIIRVCSLLIFINAALAIKISARGSYWNIKSSATITYKEQTIVFGESRAAVIMGSQLHSNPAPLFINNEKVYDESSTVVKPPKLLTPTKNFADFAVSQLQKEISQLGNGKYSISMITLIIGKSGEVAFFDFRDIVQVSENVRKLKQVEMTELNSHVKSNSHAKLPKGPSVNEVSRIKTVFAKALESGIKFEPAALKSGKQVYYNLQTDDFALQGFFIVNNHKVSYEKF